MRTLRADEVEVRVGTVGRYGISLLLYKNARVDRQVLDETFGTMNWQCRYSEHKGNLFCSIGVYDPDKDEWTWKEDCGTESNTEKEKGEASDAFKRAGFRWGIGIELYSSPFIFLNVATEEANGRYKILNRDDGFGYYVSEMSVVNGKIKDLTIMKDYKGKKMVMWSTDNRKVGRYE